MTGIGGPSPHADSPQNPRNNKCFSMALSPRGQFSRSLNIMTSFPHFRYQNTQKVMPLNILLRGKKKKQASVLQKANETSGFWVLGLNSKTPATCPALQEPLLFGRAEISKTVLNCFATFGFPEILWMISILPLTLSSCYYSRWQSQWLAPLKRQPLHQLQQMLNVIVLCF